LAQHLPLKEDVTPFVMDSEPEWLMVKMVALPVKRHMGEIQRVTVPPEAGPKKWRHGNNLIPPS
jgi:hypothetical protein